MRKFITIILVLIGFAAYAQPSNSSSYLYQNAKWRFKYPIWADSGIYVKNIVKNANQNRVCIIDSVTGKVGFKYITGGTTDTTSLSNRINLRVKYTDTSAMLSPYFLASDSIQWRNRVRYADTAAMLTKYLRKADTLHMTYTSPLKRQGNDLSIPVATGSISGYLSSTDWTTFNNKGSGTVTSVAAGNGLTGTTITTTGTLYVDTLKQTSQYGNTWANNMYLGSSNNRSILFRTNNLVRMKLDSNGFNMWGTTTPVIPTPLGTFAHTTFSVTSANHYFVIESKVIGNPVLYLKGTALGQIMNEVGDLYINNISAAGSLITRMGTGVTRVSTVFTNGNLQLGAGTADLGTGVKLSIPIAPTASPNYALFSLSNTATAFNGSTSGYFVGAPAGTYFGINSVGSVAYNYLQFSKNGVSRFKVDSLGYVKGANLYSNSYTPTLTGVTNVSSSQAYTCQYSRVDSVVTVSGTIGITATSNNARTTIGISLPVASNFTAISNAGGAGYTTANTTAGHGAGIYADATNDRVELDYYETHGTADIFTFSFTYRIK